MSTEQDTLRKAKMQSLLRTTIKKEEEAKELEGLVTLPKDGDSLEANFDVAEANEIEVTFEGKTRKQISFKFKAKDGSEKSIRLAHKWAKSALELMSKNNGVARLKITRIGQGKEETEYVIEPVPPA